MSSVFAGSSSTFVTKKTFIGSYVGSSAVCSYTNTELNPWIKITMKASTIIDKVVLLPPVGGLNANGDVCPFVD